MKKLIPFIMILASVIIGCKSTSELNGNWITTALIKDGVSQAVSESNIEFNSKGSVVNIGGKAGVNLFNGDIKVKGNSISANDFALTKMMGAPEDMDFEDLFMKALTKAETYEINGDILSIKAPSQNIEIQLKKQK